GVRLEDSSNSNTISQNTIIGSSIIGIDLYGVGYFQEHNLIFGNELRNGWYAVHFLLARNGTIEGNTAENNSKGFVIYRSFNTTIAENTVRGNVGQGVYLDMSYDGRVYHNNFIDNGAPYLYFSSATWDSGYPSGGNFWSEYVGVDLNRDGIGDVNHTVNAENADMYPLMGLFHSFSISDGCTVDVVSNSTLDGFEYFESNSTIKLHVSNTTSEQVYGFCRARIPYTLMNETAPITVLVNGAEPHYWNYTLYDDGTSRWVYFEYEHSTLEIVIAPESAPSDMPVVFVDPLNVTADVGESFTISVKVFNLSENFYTTIDPWVEGEPLPPFEPALWQYNYSLGYLYGLDLRLRWDPAILEYVNHTVFVSVEDYPDGILHEPIFELKDEVDPAAGTYWFARLSMAPAAAFNAPGMNATAFTMTFTVKKMGMCGIDFTNVDLVAYVQGLDMTIPIQPEIPHWVKNGQFQTSTVWTYIESVQAGAPVAGSLLDPAVQGEDVVIRVAMRNANDTVTDTFNLTLYEGTTPLFEWQSEELAPGSAETYNYTIHGLGVGLHSVTAAASILHGSGLETDELSRSFTVVDTPTLQISGPSSAATGQTVAFSAEESVHNDPNGRLLNYTWTLWAPGEATARAAETGESVSFDLPPTTAELGNWTVMLVIRDSYGITAQAVAGTLTPASELLRPATDPYRETVLLEVLEPLVITVLTPENKTYLADDVPLVFTVSRPATWIGYSLDGQANVTIADNTTLLDLSDGPHSIRVFAEDAHGIIGASETVHFSVKDATPPTPAFPLEILAVIVVVIGAAAAVSILYLIKTRRARKPENNPDPPGT
ncbi:MAG: right-handed parallel beta-helix repeat-containing protein, partial [Aigarchaeota archaeon]|nr:right-handed parallel beta-helix repeat-containing protein [Aigarchaeota archaeon]